jgi:hypothetical protein
MGEVMFREVRGLPGYYVRFGVDLDFLEWMGWHGFAVLDAALRTGAQRLGWAGYADQELMVVDERPGTSFTLTFQVWPPGVSGK